MKGTLNRLDNGYMLLVDGIIYATDNDKLSKEKCDSLFGVVDVVKLACEEIQIDPDAYNHINTKANEKNASPCVPLNEGGCVGAALYFQVNGFIKAMELNSDKLFTLEDVRKAFSFYAERAIVDMKFLDDDFVEFIKSLQPTEIEVEVVTEPMNIDEIREQGKGFLNTNTNKPKLDKNGCLILKKK